MTPLELVVGAVTLTWIVGYLWHLSRLRNHGKDHYQ